MENTPKKLSASDAIIMLIDCVNKNKMPDFYNVADRFAENYSHQNDIRYRLKKLIRERPMQMQRLDELSSNIKKLLLLSAGSDENVYIPKDLQALLDELLTEWANADSYRFHNIKTRNKILFYGSTGNGKTTIAKYIAAKSNLLFVEVKSDDVIDSHLGSTSSNIYNIFNSVKQPCILFWDEVDSIGCKRGNDVHAAGHENDRMTNSFLVNMEKLAEDVIFIAATNRRDVLDSAFLRRFDIEFEILPPNNKEKQGFLSQMMQYYKLPIEAPTLENLNSYSDIKNDILKLARSHILNTILKRT